MIIEVTKKLRDKKVKSGRIKKKLYQRNEAVRKQSNREMKKKGVKVQNYG